MTPQPNQKAFTVDANKAHLFPGPAAARRSDTPEFGEAGIGARPRWGRCHCDGFYSAIQPFPTHLIHVNCSTIRDQ